MHASGSSSAPPTIKRLANAFAIDGDDKQAITRYAIATSSDNVREDKTLRIQSGISFPIETSFLRFQWCQALAIIKDTLFSITCVPLSN